MVNLGGEMANSGRRAGEFTPRILEDARTARALLAGLWENVLAPGLHSRREAHRSVARVNRDGEAVAPDWSEAIINTLAARTLVALLDRHVPKWRVLLHDGVGAWLKACGFRSPEAAATALHIVRTRMEALAGDWLVDAVEVPRKPRGDASLIKTEDLCALGIPARTAQRWLRRT